MKASYNEQTRLPCSRNMGELKFSLMFALGRFKSRKCLGYVEESYGFHWLVEQNKQRTIEHSEGYHAS